MLVFEEQSVNAVALLIVQKKFVTEVRKFSNLVSLF